MKKDVKLSEKTKKEVIERSGNWCFECGTPYGLDWSHLVRKSALTRYGQQELYDDARNVVRDCRDCHTIWDNGAHEKRKAMQSYETRKEMVKAISAKGYSMLDALDKRTF